MDTRTFSLVQKQPQNKHVKKETDNSNAWEEARALPGQEPIQQGCEQQRARRALPGGGLSAKPNDEIMQECGGGTFWERGCSHLLGVFLGSQEGGESEVDGAGP